MFKLQIVAFVVFLAFSAKAYNDDIVTRSDPHNIYICLEPTKPKQLLAAIPVEVSGKFLQVQTKSVVFPFEGINNKTITCLSILDRDQNGKGAYPRINSGGIGYHDVQIVLKSQRSRGIRFNIEIYGDRRH